MYRTWSSAGCFETRAQELFFEGLVRGTTHLGIGQEAVAAGFAAAMRADDCTFCTYRGHNHTLARGVPMAPIFAELFGRGDRAAGRQGRLDAPDQRRARRMGSYAIVGAHLPIALGAAWSAQYRESGQVAVCFFGDGTTNIGAFHEALNMAAVWKAPVVFVCENNQYMEYTPIGDVTAVEQPGGGPGGGLRPGADRGGRQRRRSGPSRRAATAIDRARRGGGPSLIEAVTYRHGGHSRADPGKYRPDEEVAAWKARDPLPALPRAAARRRASASPSSTLWMPRRATRSPTAEAEARAAPEPRRRRPRDPGLDRRRLRMAELTYRGAIAAGIAQEMERDPSVVLIGEDIGAAGGVFKLTEGLFDKFGPERVRDTPISEQAIVGAAMGAAMTGPAAGRRADVLRLLRGGLGHGREPDRQDPLHDRRPGLHAARPPDGTALSVVPIPQVRGDGYVISLSA